VIFRVAMGRRPGRVLSAHCAAAILPNLCRDDAHLLRTNVLLSARNSSAPLHARNLCCGAHPAKPYRIMTLSSAKLWLYLRLKAHYLPLQFFIGLMLWGRPYTQPMPANVSHLTISGPGGRGILALYLHSPASDTNGPKPVHINFHGGAFTLPLHSINQRFCIQVCKDLGSCVVDADYQLAPDNPWPAAYDDARRVLDWVRANEGGIFDPEKITIGEFSAGANLALAIAGTAQPGEIKGVVTFYPAVDATVSYASKPAPPAQQASGKGKGMVIPPKEGERIFSAYLLGLPLSHTHAILSDPRLSLLFADRLAFPEKWQTMILSCEYDLFGPEGRDMAKKLQEAGRDPVRV